MNGHRVAVTILRSNRHRCNGRWITTIWIDNHMVDVFRRNACRCMSTPFLPGEGRGGARLMRLRRGSLVLRGLDSNRFHTRMQAQSSAWYQSAPLPEQVLIEMFTVATERAARKPNRTATVMSHNGTGCGIRPGAPALCSTGPAATGIGALNMGPAQAKVWNSPFSPARVHRCGQVRQEAGFEIRGPRRTRQRLWIDAREPCAQAGADHFRC